MERTIIKDRVESERFEFADCLLSEYRGYSLLEIQKAHKDDEVVKIVTKNNANIQIYLKKNKDKEDEICQEPVQPKVQKTIFRRQTRAIPKADSAS